MGGPFRRHAPWLLGVTATLAAYAPLCDGVRLGTPGLFFALAGVFVVLGFALHAVEGAIFTEGPSPVRGKDWLGAVASGVALAGLAAWLLGYAGATGGVAERLGAWFDARGAAAWRRLAYSAITYMVVYCVIGSATWPFVREFYEDPESPLRLRVPSGPVVIGLQLARGTVATLVLLPLVAALPEAAHVAWAWPRLALAMAVTLSIVPMLTVRDWPLRLRVIHGVEITVFALVQSFAWTWFLVR